MSYALQWKLSLPLYTVRCTRAVWLWSNCGKADLQFLWPHMPLSLGYLQEYRRIEPKKMHFCWLALEGKIMGNGYTGRFFSIFSKGHNFCDSCLLSLAFWKSGYHNREKFSLKNTFPFGQQTTMESGTKNIFYRVTSPSSVPISLQLQYSILHG